MDATNISDEVWLPIDGYPGYEVSNRGSVRSVDRAIQHPLVNRRRGKVLSGNVIKGGYLQVGLRCDGRSRSHLVHRLVLQAFVGPCPDGMEACHIDGDAANNDLDNLRWDTPSSNTFDRVKHGTHHSARKTHCPQGHSYDYFYTRPDGGVNRMCRECRGESQRRRRAPSTTGEL